ncbi:MAG: cupin domain-containing protein, partial [Nitrososphaeraceae archaeon]
MFLSDAFSVYLMNKKLIISMFVVAAALLAGSALILNPRPIYAQDSGPFVKNIVSLAKENTNFRQEIKTANHTQVVLMSLKPGEDIGLEVHKTIDQILVFVQGSGEANISGQKFPIKEGDLAFVPAGTPHDFTNTGNTD